MTNNIFLTTENLAFALPLILVCAFYAYFKYVPLPIAISILVGLFVIYQIRNRFQAIKEKKLEKLDEGMVRELAGEEEDKSKKDEEDKKKERKAKAKVQERLAAERKAQNKAAATKKKKKKASTEDDEDDDEFDNAALLTFAKGSRDTKKAK